MPKLEKENHDMSPDDPIFRLPIWVFVQKEYGPVSHLECTRELRDYVNEVESKYPGSMKGPQYLEAKKRLDGYLRGKEETAWNGEV